MTNARRIGAELNRAELDAATLTALFADIAACTTVNDVQIKGGIGEHARSGAATLEDACRLVQERQVRGVQIRYRYQDQDWCDTLLVTPRGVRLVRIGGDAAQPLL